MKTIIKIHVWRFHTPAHSGFSPLICLLVGQEQVLNPEGLTAQYFSRVYSLLRAFDLVHFVSHPTEDDDDDTIFSWAFFLTTTQPQQPFISRRRAVMLGGSWEAAEGATHCIHLQTVFAGRF